jgi:hypothetical protein
LTVALQATESLDHDQKEFIIQHFFDGNHHTLMILILATLNSMDNGRTRDSPGVWRMESADYGDLLHGITSPGLTLCSGMTLK